jgi:hypothetical protein
MGVATKVGEDLSEWLLRSVVDWQLGLSEPVKHSDVLMALVPVAPARFQPVYQARARVHLSGASPRQVAVVVPGWLALAGTHPGGRALLDDVLPAVLRERRRRDLDEVGRELHRLTPALEPIEDALDRRYQGSWQAWWDAVREQHEPPNLKDRILRRRRSEA